MDKMKVPRFYGPRYISIFTYRVHIISDNDTF